MPSSDIGEGAQLAYCASNTTRVIVERKRRIAVDLFARFGAGGIPGGGDRPGSRVVDFRFRRMPWETSHMKPRRLGIVEVARPASMPPVQMRQGG